MLEKCKYSHYELLGVVAVPPEYSQDLQAFKDHLHNKFKVLQSDGDWFLPGKTLLEYIMRYARPHICDRSCPDGPFAEEDMRALDNQASNGMQNHYTKASLSGV
jgi:hypothetical protein